MHPTGPPDSMAPHIPADDYRRAQATGQPIVIIRTTTAPAPRRPARAYLLPIAVAGAAAIGLLGVVAAFLALLDAAARTAIAVGSAAGPLGIGGITFKLTRSKTK
ncbi:hypothetical protein [Streptomyces longispororuber]|uniref:hypothetical protein n=1 Tax=Streptomyces longispororuber TaxID=68230 RepID=UPI0036FFF735